MDKLLVEIGVEHPVDSMMQEPIPDRSLVDVARLGVRDIECLIRRVFISPAFQAYVEIDDIRREIYAEPLHILSLPFPVQEFYPSSKEIIERDDIIKDMTRNIPPQQLLPILEKVKCVYILWHSLHATLPKAHRYILGNRIDDIFIALLESVSTAAFSAREEKLPYVRISIRKLDTLKILLLVLWETKSVDNKRYMTLSEPLDEIGRMLGGWYGQLNKQNSLALAREK